MLNSRVRPAAGPLDAGAMDRAAKNRQEHNIPDSFEAMEKAGRRRHEPVTPVGPPRLRAPSHGFGTAPA